MRIERNDVTSSRLYKTTISFVNSFDFSLDLVPVSSTVIPESELPNQEEITAEMDKEYKKAYFSLFKKKFDSKFEKPDTLMTDKKKFAKNSEKRATKKPE